MNCAHRLWAGDCFLCNVFKIVAPHVTRPFVIGFLGGDLMGFTRSDLKDLDKVWKDGLTSGASEADIPEGKYQAKVKEVELGKSSGGRPQCKWVWKIIGGAVEEVIGKEHTTYDGLESAMNMGFFFKKLRRFQIKPPESFEDMDEAVQKCLGAVVDIQVKVKDDFTNVYVNKLVKAGAASAEKDEEEEEDDNMEDNLPPITAQQAADLLTMVATL